MIRRPPRSPHLPHTTLYQSRSLSNASRTSGQRSAGSPASSNGRQISSMNRRTKAEATPRAFSSSASRTSNERRSEEHTSELQSRQYLVCRLLLEKNNPSPPL